MPSRSIYATIANRNHQNTTERLATVYIVLATFGFGFFFICTLHFFGREREHDDGGDDGGANANTADDADGGES